MSESIAHSIGGSGQAFVFSARPVPVQPPQIPPRPALWVVIEPPVHFNKYRKAWAWAGFLESFEHEEDAQDCANEKPGSVIFRLPGSGEVGQ